MTTTGVGSTSYSYNAYHQLSSETITLKVPNSNPLTDVGSYTLGYQYNYVGAPTKATYTVGGWVKNVNYAYKYSGSLDSVGTDLISGGSSTNNTNVVNTLTYRGFGGVKSLNFGTNPRLMQISYDAKRQQMTNLYIRRVSNTGTDNVIFNSDYDFYNGGANNGRIQKVTDNTDSTYTTTYGYDAASRMKTAGSDSYEYDGDGHRVKQHVSGYSNSVYYLWSSVFNEPVVEVDSTTPSVFRAHVYGPGGQMLALQSYDGNFYWLHTDALGNGRKMTNTSGSVIYRAEYDPHGQMLYEWQSSGYTYLNSYKFTGYERDWSTNLDNAKARTLNHNRGRFMQPDPMGLGAADVSDPQSLNLYSYVQNDPMNFVDPTGMFLAQFCFIVDWTGWNSKGESVTGSSEVCVIVDVGGGFGGGPGGPIGPTDPTGGDDNGNDEGQKPKQQKPQKGPCDVEPGDNLFGNFFSKDNLKLFNEVASKLSTNVLFVMTHSAWESGYGGPHAQELHNLFGLTHGGGRNQKFSTYQEGANQYVDILSNTSAKGAKTFDDYISGLKQAGYNSATPGYYNKVKSMLDSVTKHYNECRGDK